MFNELGTKPNIDNPEKFRQSLGVNTKRCAGIVDYFRDRQISYLQESN